MPPKAKHVEGIVLIVDVSPNVRASTETTFYHQAKQCLIKILQRKIFADKCKDMVGIVLFGTDETSNDLANGDQYQHVSVFQDIKFVDWELMSRVDHLPRGNSQGDWLDALIVAMDLLRDPQNLIYTTKKIVLITDFNTDFTDDQAETIINGLIEMSIELTVIGPSMSEGEDYNEDAFMTDPSTSSGSRNHAKPNLNWNGKVKTSRQLAAEALIKRIVAMVEGIICDFDEAIPQLIFFEKKSQGSANWNSMLDIGPDLQIPITGRIKIKHSSSVAWKRSYAEDGNEATITETSHHKKDVEMSEVDDDAIIAGYRYGTTLVPYGDENKQLQYECDVPGATLSVLGFTRSNNVPLEMRAGDQVMVITAKEGDEDGAVAISAIIQALKELDMVAITRKVYRKRLNPVMGALYPDITSDYECLVWIGLPFQEDTRQFSFPSLDKTLENLTVAQKNVIDQLIDAMDLTENDDQDELLEPMSVVNPQLQHHFNCLTQRAIDKEQPIPPPAQHVLDILSPPFIQQHVRDILASKLSKLFPIEKLEVKKKKDALATAVNGDPVASTSATTNGIATSSDLTGTIVTNVSTVSPAQDFRSLLQGDQPNYISICRQMEQVILQLSENLSGENSTDNILLTKIVESLKCFREEATVIDYSPYNALLTHLKSLVIARSFNHLWLLVKTENLGLVKQSETLKSSVSEEEATKFLALEEPTEVIQQAPPVEEDNYDDMLDDL